MLYAFLKLLFLFLFTAQFHMDYSSLLRKLVVLLTSETFAKILLVEHDTIRMIPEYI